MMEIVLDVGPSMREDGKLDLAKSLISQFMLQRMMASKTMEFGVVTFGDNHTQNELNKTQGGYEGVQEVVAMGRPDDLVLLSLQNLLQVGSQPGDLIDGIIVAQDILIRTHGGKAFNKVMLILTDGETKVEGVEDLETILANMVATKNFCLYLGLLGPAATSTIKKENAKLLRSLAESTQGRFMEVQTIADGLRLLSAGMGLSSKPQVSRTSLQITPALKLRCVYWAPISKASPPSLKKRPRAQAMGEEDDGGEEGEGEGEVGHVVVKRDISYRDPEDPDLEVPTEERVKGYRYGTQYIPLTAADEEMARLGAGEESEEDQKAGIVVLGAVPRSSIPSHHLLLSPFFLHAAVDSPQDQQCLSALVVAAQEEGVALLARMRKRDRAEPFLAALLPTIPDRFLVFRLPFVEDVREINLPSLIAFSAGKNSKGRSVQWEAMDSLVEALTVRSPDAALVTPSNGAIRAIYDRILSRLLEQHGLFLRPPNAANDAAAVFQQAARPTILSLYEAFPLVKRETKKKNQRTYWSDIAVEGQQQPAQPLEASQQEEEEEEPQPLAVATATPVEDFSNLIRILQGLESKKVETAESVRGQQREALDTMIHIVDRNILFGGSPVHYKRAVSCLTALRDASIALGMPESYNSYLQGLPQRSASHAEVFRLLQNASLSFISSAECSASLLSEEERSSYLCQEVSCTGSYTGHGDYDGQPATATAVL
eukprot:scaffold633_cov288-Ochromonas_danica.AAC.83